MLPNQFSHGKVLSGLPSIVAPNVISCPCVSPHPLETDAIILAPRPAAASSEPMEIETISHPSHGSTPGEVRTTHTHTLTPHLTKHPYTPSHRYTTDSEVFNIKIFSIL